MSGPAAGRGARDLAFSVLRDVFGPEQRGAHASFDFRARRTHLDARDRAFAAQLAYGAIEQRRLLDWYLAPYLRDRSKPLPPAIAEILRLGAYQLRCMNGVDPHAAVYETVALAMRYGHRGTGGLVNAILRRLAHDEPAAPARADFAGEDDYLGTAFSLPTWVVAHWGRQFDGARDALLAGVNAPPQAALRVNTLRAGVAATLQTLAGEGVAARRSPYVGECLVLAGGERGDDPAGRWTVQNEAACMPVDLLAPQRGEHVLELCSGRGNKSLQLAARLENAGSLHCVELSARDARVWSERIEQAGVTCAALVEGDARAAELPQARAVLLDAPCSGLGILGRQPEARWRKQPGDAPRLAPQQAELLAAAAAHVEPGGRLVYSVCSTDPREGREQIDALLAREPEFARAALPDRYADFAREGDVLIPPGLEGRDGFYIASLVRGA